MDDSNDFDFSVSNPNEPLIQHGGSQSEDENEHNVYLADEESIYNEIHDEDDDFGSSSEIELHPSPVDHLEGKSDFDSKIINPEIKNESSAVKSFLDEITSPQRNKRSSERLRKEGKVPMHTKNLFPARPRRKKFAPNLNLNFSENLTSIKSPTISNQEIDTIEKSSIVFDVTHPSTIEPNEMMDNVGDQQTMPDIIRTSEIVSTTSIEENVVQIQEKIPTAKKKLNYPGKIKGKLGGRRNKTMEYRKKRGPKGKFKNFSSVSSTFSSGTNLAISVPVHETEKQEESGNENKIILCSSTDNFVLSQDLCVMCGSLGRDEESRLLSCSQCGQCYHPFCAGIKITKIMLKKGWRCLECTVCEGCGKPTDESRLLLCDDCDISYHTYCLDPPLEEVPQGTWKCQWCVVCVKCHSTSPGYRSQWQENYNLCGPCASQEKCSACKMNYEENDLIIQCIQCLRWLHSKCDSMFDENECEIASSIGYHCLNCRPPNEPPPHIQARKNGTLRSIFNKKRAEERNDPALMKKNEAQKDSLDGSFDSTVNENGTVNASAKLLSKYHLVDGVYLSEAGLAMIKSQAVEQPKKTRVKRKNVKEEIDESSNNNNNNKDFEENIDENNIQSEEEKKKRLRRLRLDKLGIGGFLIKQRGRLSLNKEEDEISQDNYERSLTPDNPDKPRRRRRISKKKNHLQDQYPSYLQEAFFGKNLLDVIANNELNSDLHLNEENESEEEEQKSIGNDKIVNLNSLELVQNLKNNKNDELNFLDDDNFQAESFDDFSALSPDDAFVDMLMNDENLDRNEDEVLNELAENTEKNDTESKIEMEDILDPNFNLNELNDTGLPQMDSKDVEDLFEVMSNNSMTPAPSVPVVAQSQIPSKEYQTNTDDGNPAMMHQSKPNVEPLDLPLIPNKVELSGSSTPVTPLSSESLSNIQQQFSTFESNQPINNPYKISSNPTHDTSNPSNYYIPAADPDLETPTQGQKNNQKWESEEALGQCATISAVLYSNINHPNLKTEYPVLQDRIKQIHKIWRQLPADQRAPYLQMARENRSASKKNQAEMMNKMNSNKNSNKIDSDKQWKDMSSSNAAILNGSNMNVSCSMSSPGNELVGYPLSSDGYSNHGSTKLYSSSSMNIHSGQPNAITQLSPNQMMINMQQQQTQSSHHPPPMSPAMHSPRMRPYNDNYVQQQPQPPPSVMNPHNQMNMMRPVTSTMVTSQSSFSPNSPSLNAPVHSECYQSSPSTPQRPQSTDLQQQQQQQQHSSYGSTTSPYGPSRATPFSPNQIHQTGIHPNNVASDPYLQNTNQTNNNMENPANIDVYKVNITTQHHQLSKPHTPDSSSTYIQTLSSSSLPSTPQPPPSPQLPVPQSPLSDMYARSPTTSRPPPPSSAVSGQPVRQSSQFDDNYNQRQAPESLYSPNTNANAYSPQYLQPNTVSYNMSNDGYNTPPPPQPPPPSQDVKIQIRPNMIGNVSNRPNIPLRRAISDSYTRQPVSNSENFPKMDDNPHDQHSKQHLRNLLQVQQMRRQEPTSAQQSPATTVNRQMWSTENNFRQPMSPALNRNRLPIATSQQQSYTMNEQSFRFSNDQRLSMIQHRNPSGNGGDIRFRPVASNQQQQQFSVRFATQHQINQQIQMKQQQQQHHQGSISKLPQQQQPQQQWQTNSSTMNHPNQMNLMVQMSANQNFPSQVIANIRQPIKSENLKTENDEIKSQNEMINAEDVEESSLPVELGDDDELLQLGNDFNILEYADPELDDKPVTGSGKTNIFDELDEKDMLNEKEKENEANKNDKSNETKNEIVSNNDVKPLSESQQHHQTFNQINYGQTGNETSRIYVQNKATEVDHQSSTPKHEQQYFQNPDCFISDDDFERFKNDYLNDSDQQMNPGIQGSNQMNPYSVQQQTASSMHHPPSTGNLMSSQTSMSNQSPTPSHQIYQQQTCQQYNPVMNSGQQQQQQPVWPDKSSFNKMTYQNRMHLRMPINQGPPPPPMARHMQPGMYPQPGNRIMLQQTNPHIQMSNNPMMRPVAINNISSPNENESYDLLQKQKLLENEISKLRKVKKSLNAKQRACRKNQTELAEHDANELARLGKEIVVKQKHLEQIRKMVRQTQGNVLQDKRKSSQNVNLPHSPSTQTSPRSVNSPLAVLSTSGSGTPLDICPSTPQSPSLTSPSPSSLMQNSPISSLHSPASMMPPSPMPNNSEMGVPVRPQIVQDDNNPFSDVYLQKEKKQQTAMYQQIPKEINPMDSRQSIYSNNFDDQSGPQQQYYHGQPSQTVPYSMGNMRPQSMNFSNNNNYRFQSGINAHAFASQQQQINYQQQMRRPPPPPYPGNTQHYSRAAVGSAYPLPPNQQQIRIQSSMRNPLECNINPSSMTSSHPIYNDASSPMMQPNDSSYQVNQMDPMPIVGEAETTMEFTISEPGNGVDNESDPFTFLKETTDKTNKSNEQSDPNIINNNININVPSSSLSQSTINSSDRLANINNNNISNMQHANVQNEFISVSNNEKFGLNIDDQPDYSHPNESRLSNYSQGDRHSESISDNSEDDASRQENSKQNALLKKLLQNCPSADLKSLNQENQDHSSSMNDMMQNETETLTSIVDNKLTTNNNEMNDQMTNANENRENNANPIISANEITNVTIIPSSTTAPAVEKKLSYLDIRRAQLERDPTPPLEDIKPKRKRTVKRKESNKSTDGDSIDHNNTNLNVKTKKRTRKGSQTKNDDQNIDSICNNEKILTSIMNHFRTLPSIEIVEPEVKINLNVCLPPDASDFNLKKPKLKGCYGNAFLSSAIDYYSTYPFGPNKASSIVAPINSNISNPNKVGYYSEEFGRSILEMKEHLKERQIKNESLSLYSRDIDSPDTVISASSPECILYDHPKDEYNRMKFINDHIDSEDEDRKSPFLTFLPIRPIPIYSSKALKENNKENYDENQKSKLVKVNSSGAPLKESGNVGITIMIKSEHDVKNVMKALAKLLNLKSSFTYNIEKSPTSRTTEVVEIISDDDENVYCKFCNCLIKIHQSYKANGDINRIDLALDDYFCNKECFKNYALTNVNIVTKNEIMDSKDEDLTENDATENELVSIFNQSDHGTDDLDSIISIHEKHWKNTRYLYWNGSSFKQENKVQNLEEERGSEQLYRMNMRLKTNQNCIDKRYCIFCNGFGDGTINGPSRLLNMDVDKWVHLNCALWSNEVYEMLNGALMNVDQAYKRAMNSVCVSCTKFGASIKCFKFRCNNSYHFPCALREKCVFYTDKTLFCPVHCAKAPLADAKEMSSFVVGRRVYINRDEQKQIAAMIHQGDNNLMRIGSLIFLNIGQLLPHQLQNFHTHSYIYPIGYRVSRFYWSSRRLGERCQYICSIDELDGKPQFSIEIREEGYENVTYQASTPKLAWEEIIKSIVKLREESQSIKVFFDFISGEDLFGLNEPAIIRILESLPGVDTLYDYNFKYGRSPWYELPLAINPSGCARTEPFKRFHFKRPHTLHVSSNTARSSLQSPLTNSESSSPYVKQFVHSKVSQYRKMKIEWQGNVYLGRSRIQGLGLYANKDIEKHTMIIEYIGLVIRNSIADRNERIHEAHNRGIYMFRLDDNRVIDATLQGGLARYVNHSCDPNCVAECVQIDRENKILIIANRRIQKGEELTYDYKFDVEDDQHKIPCLCGAANCRKWMN